MNMLGKKKAHHTKQPYHLHVDVKLQICNFAGFSWLVFLFHQYQNLNPTTTSLPSNSEAWRCPSYSLPRTC